MDFGFYSLNASILTIFFGGGGGMTPLFATLLCIAWCSGWVNVGSMKDQYMTMNVRSVEAKFGQTKVRWSLLQKEHPSGMKIEW